MSKRLYVGALRGLRRLLAAVGVLALLDRWAARSRTGLWVRSWLAIYDLEEMLALGVPWWTFAAVDRVEEFLQTRPGARVFEWGSGASTAWLAARSGWVRSIEHDAAWAQEMATHLPANARLDVVPPVPCTRPAQGSAKAGFENLDFSDYVAAIEGEEELDLVVVDGRAREACLPAAVRRLAPGGMVVFDNVDRVRYRDAITALVVQHPGAFEVTWTRGRTPSLPYPTRTALLRAAPGAGG